MKSTTRMTAAALALLLLAGAMALPAAVRLPRLISDGMVLQRDARVKIRGWADPGEEVTVHFRGRTARTRADARGEWSVRLPSGPAGGPFTLEIAAKNRITLKEIYAGEVWVCSGQSNMQLPIARVADRYPLEIATSENPAIRQFLVPMRYDFTTPQQDLPGGSWEGANPENVRKFSAAGYFFARALFDRYHVPIGLINASIGGTPVEAWMSAAALHAWPVQLDSARYYADSLRVRAIQTSDRARSRAWFGTLHARDAGYAAANGAWIRPEFDDSAWPLLPVPSRWQEQPLGPLTGSVWFRKTVELHAALAGAPGRLLLGTIVDSDSAWVNGVFVGSVSYQYPPRKYEIPAGLLREGKNLITLRVVSNRGGGEFIRDKVYGLVAAGDTIDLSGSWRYQVGALMESAPGQTFIEYKPLGLFNGMIAPLLQTRIRGVIWNQGESNTGRPEGYHRILAAMISDWRRQWGLGDFPFILAQLANYMAPSPAMQESGWAALRDEQRRTLQLENTGMAVAIDLGEWNDLHPLNKGDLGFRLALWARRLAHGEGRLVCSGPLLRDSKVEKGKMVLRFTHTGSGLAVKGGGALQHFAIAGADGRYYPAQARIRGDRVEVWSESVAQPAVVRYAWAHNPQGANLINREGLPASPFCTRK